MIVENDKDIEGLRRIGAVVAEVREAMLRAVEPGISTFELDAIARELFDRHGARSAPQLVYDFPGATCISVNHQAAHGVPSARLLQAGDIVNVDVSAELDGYFADTGASAAVGEVVPRVQELLHATKEAQAAAMAAAQTGRSVRHLARAVQRRAREGGFTVVTNLLGHGVGRSIHEPPEVPSVVDDRYSTMLTEGMVIAIEPFLSLSADPEVEALEEEDGWTLSTYDRSLVAQFEHTVVITRGAPIVITAA